MGVLEVSGLKKAFGDQVVLDGVDFSVREGSIFGFIGKNGEGKTTTMNIALGLLKADQGRITIGGETVKYGDTATNRLVGYLPDVPEFYSFLTAREYMKLCLDVSGIERKRGKQKIAELLDMVGLEDNKKRISHYSRGMKQRLGIAQALINDPLLLICDEPTSALDPIGRQQLLTVLKKVKDKTTVIFSTHILSDVETVCDEVAILDAGRIVRQGSIQELKAQTETEKWSLLLENEAEALTVFSVLKSDARLANAVLEGCTVQGTSPDSKAAMKTVLSIVHTLSVVPLRLERKEPTIEEVFMEVVQ
ncbi:ABC transporter, ATP-binding protein [Alkalibacterium sp. AK22]|uniref:ABC transporter ATP-binding protein n=1 Tax=Alkalibacterium sp. AK22 TaxID=1229520 RepID=UPI000445750B|nr:ABC transporter ATP-binding protein [Alkalibacterium sp. AK22]EXJ23032.1 ABC transporter, ATP-binding protein [Alkalibacterium sp. AK22]